jgi:hypothetical protein
MIKITKRNDDGSTRARVRIPDIGCLTALGMPPAIWCSWTINHSLLWAGFHGLFWWLYLPYLCIGCGGGFPKEIPW